MEITLTVLTNITLKVIKECRILMINNLLTLFHVKNNQ